MDQNGQYGPIHLQADSAFEASSTGLRPVNWPDFFPGKNRPINWPEADSGASSEANCLRPIRRPVQKLIEVNGKEAGSIYEQCGLREAHFCIQS